MKDDIDNKIINSNVDCPCDNELQSQKLEALGKFAGGIAHDFNNILSIIEGYVCLAVKKLDKGELTKEDLQKILKSTERGAGLTKQLLSFGRMKIDLEEKINMAEALKDFHILLRPVIGETINLFFSVPDTPIWINASKGQITQIFLNLAINARDAMPGGGNLSIMFAKCREDLIPQILKDKYPGVGFVRINVTDNGSGIPSEIISKIFDPFFTTKGPEKGVGLGLSVVFGTVQQLSGHIEVSSRVGEGAAFDVYLPTVSAPDEAGFMTDLSGFGDKDPRTRVRINENSEGLKNRTIMIAEDEPELRDLLKEMFEDMEMNVLTAPNGNEALVVQDDYDKEIDFLLTDVVMPGMNGIKLGELFNSVRPESEVIYMSGYPFIDGSDDLGVPSEATFISKPLQEEKVKKILERAVQRRKERVGEDK